MSRCEATARRTGLRCQNGAEDGERLCAVHGCVAGESKGVGLGREPSGYCLEAEDITDALEDWWGMYGTEKEAEEARDDLIAHRVKDWEDTGTAHIVDRPTLADIHVGPVWIGVLPEQSEPTTPEENTDA